MKRVVKASYDEALARIPELLKEEGFGVLTRIDVRQTLKEKIGVDFRRYQILALQSQVRAPGPHTEVGSACSCLQRAVWRGRRPHGGGRGRPHADDCRQDPRLREWPDRSRAARARALEAR